ncbi:tryptophan synthase subunit alpha [Lentilactobacillus curieae]|uniref:Tryptophan synthase alpha chain n=1 Tax=Lentilactobacillus curieae TaxID=1138822 RepID=A0A1S6QI05_9LACO|nr:tryptophan synthase subunit alpha [Lentilactobacillus curieae]AQW21236.1 tryptophan synthase subunit alpha [Lentilactobacillus curieae]
MSNLSDIFKNKKAFIPFVVADDPDFDTTVKNVVSLANGGADIVELGIPFSDPVADGPVIQAADLRAFKAGITTDKVFEIVEAVRKLTDVPIVFLTYLNIPFKYGFNRFLKRCSELNVSGLVIPDLPLESRDEIVPTANQYGIDIIPLVTPTSGNRIKKIAEAATGFIYVVSSMGITGQRDSFYSGIQELVAEIRKYTNVPTAIGFGVHTPEQAAQMAEIADGVIIGSAIVDIIDKHGISAPEQVNRFAVSVSESINQEGTKAAKAV